ncbi:lycopene cyclase domain-containing protein [Halobacterium sp. CBA1126]|uniref:lycopene cyclase domain-containing protein n=1 Tax=Halobacterium TaxID=2239 RepID=UPI0012F8EB8D|nr:lycopene cyclase domain-containing protein [Halobacterium sp. CBA1126]MUV60365.1 lycopene cyclase domain-containing protein [Halobacterium sp. CBA1126]
MATYLQFLAAFVAPPLLALAALRLRDRREAWWSLAGVGVLVVLALAYTTPWDNYLIRRGVWTYGADAVLARVWLAPVEEYAFVAAQTVVTGLWVQRVADSPDAGFAPTTRDAAVGALAGLAVTAAGVHWLRAPATFYLGAIFAWAGPVLALQWAVGCRYLWARPRVVAAGVAVPTLYFAVADRLAIADGIWALSAEYTTGVAVAGLPVEEGAFFLVTNLFVAQGLVLYDWVVARWG